MVADRARAEADALLANILPEAIAERLKARPGERVADTVPEASVLFSDLVGFTGLAQRLGAARTMALLDAVVTEFDKLAAAHGVEKIKTIGDGYMAVAGVSRPQADHLLRLARMALLLPELVERLSAAHGVELRIRVGIASGPLMAGVIGSDKFSYDVWGETVNLASRLESHGLPGEIQVSGAVRGALCDSFVFEPRGEIEVKGVGEGRDLAAQAPPRSDQAGLAVAAGAARPYVRRHASRQPAETHGSENPPVRSPLAPAAIEADPHRARHPARRRRAGRLPAGARLLDDPARPSRAVGRPPHRAALAASAHRVVAPPPGRAGRTGFIRRCDAKHRKRPQMSRNA
jgi:class 3 adenylate cyclase